MWLWTPWPEVYEDLPIHCVPFGSHLRTQAKNERTALFAPTSGKIRPDVRLGYEFHDWPLHKGFERCLPLAEGQRWVHDLPVWPKPSWAPDRPYAVVRPVTRRREWDKPARNPRPEYLWQAAVILSALGLAVVSVADLEEGQERLDGPAPPADVTRHDGCPVKELLGLIRHASLVVTGVGFATHAAIASGTPLIHIAGGYLAQAHPDRETDPRQDHSKIGWLLPDNPCMCMVGDHDCHKHIAEFDSRFRAMALSLLQ